MPYKPNNLLKIKNYHALTSLEQAQLTIMLAKPKNFFLTYFQQLPYATSNTQCFNKLNELHYQIWQEYMYTNYKSFQTVYSRYLKSRKTK